MTLLALYLGALVLGGILVGASMMGAGKDTDADHGDADHGDADHGDLGHGDADHGDADHGDVDHDHDHGHVVHHEHPDAASALAHADPGVLAILRSVRFWTFFAASFGLAGTLLTFTGAPALVSLPLAIGTGVLAGGVVSWTVRTLARDTVGTETSTRQLAGREAEVVLAVGPGKRGKVRVSHNGSILDLPAVTRDEEVIERGARVLIVEMKDGTADVTPAEPHRPATPTPLAH